MDQQRSNLEVTTPIKIGLFHIYVPSSMRGPFKEILKWVYGFYL